MKKIWSVPEAIAEQFAANEYVAACGDSGVSAYYFECDAPGGHLYYYPDSDGKIDGVYEGTGNAVLLGKSYHACGEKHEAATTNPFYDGFVDYNKDKVCDKNERVIVWRGPYNNNGHATAQLDMDTWETTKS